MKNIKGIIVAVVSVIVILAVQRIAFSLISPGIKPKSGGSIMYLEYGATNDTYYSVKKNNLYVALFLERQQAEDFAKEVGGTVEIFAGR